MSNWKKGLGVVPVTPARPGRRTVSACLIVRDEEATLARCLTSLLGAVEEIVVVDTGSQDGTIEIARKHGAVVGHFAWQDDFAAARNAALDLARGDWVLSIDADEWLADEDARNYLRAAAQTRENVAYVPYIRMPNGQGHWASTRLFPRVGSRWEHRVHEQIRLPRRDTTGIHDESFLLLHDGYEGTEEEKAARQRRNQTLLDRQLQESRPGSDAYRHAVIYSARALENPLSEANLATMEEALLAAVPHDEISTQLLTYRLYRHWLETGNFDEIDRVNNLLWKAGARGPLVHYARAVGYFEEGKNADALAALELAERVNDWVHVRAGLRPLFVRLRDMLTEAPRENG